MSEFTLKVIGAVRQKYTIFKGTLPIDFMIKRDQEDIPLVERIVVTVVLSITFGYIIIT